MKYNVLEAKNQLSQLIQSALAGEEIIIAKRGNPVVRLVPIEGTDRSSLSRSHDLTFSEWLRLNPLPEHLRRNHDEIEQSIASQGDSWE